MTDKFDDIKIGAVISNDEIHKRFGVSSQGGMRKSNKNNCLVLISKKSNNLYPDKWDGDILLYTGMGQTGDQNINAAQNKTLNESKSLKTKVYLFINTDVDKYCYYGQVELADDPYKPYKEDSPDAKHHMRKVWIFPLKMLENTDTIREKNKEIDENYNKNISKVVSKQSNDTLIQNVKDYERANANKPVSHQIINTTSYQRNPRITMLANRFANGYCQLCNKPAPFTKKDGTPYLEAHHIKWLSDGGSDTMDNVIAICANCHRRMHQLKDPKDIKILKDKAKHFAKNHEL